VKKGVRKVNQVAPAVLWVDRATLVDGGAREALTELFRHPPGTAAVLERGTGAELQRRVFAETGDLTAVVRAAVEATHS